MERAGSRPCRETPAHLPTPRRTIRRARTARRDGRRANGAHAASRGVPMKTLVSWSSGKDSAWLVHVLRQSPDIQIAGLLTTINDTARRVAMHAVRVDLLQAQADALGLPLWQIPIPSPCPNDVYERAMASAG